MRSIGPAPGKHFGEKGTHQATHSNWSKSNSTVMVIPCYCASTKREQVPATRAGEPVFYAPTEDGWTIIDED